jgi:demethylmenaquinone methyltransferase/2-methoxy-6-polyprenyl-1,4-benzoquinol methylase
MPGAAAPPSERSVHARALFAELPRRYEAMGSLWSFGQDPRWRRFLVTRIAAPRGGRILDVATGTGAVAAEVMRQHLVAVVGLDQSEPMLRRGADRMAGRGLGERMSFVLGQAERLPFPDGSFDGLTFTYLLRYVDDPGATMAELARVVKPGGTVASLEFHVPRAPWRPLWWVYTRGVMPAVGRVVSRPWYEVGRFLGPSVSTFVRDHPVEEQVAMWRAAGLQDVRHRLMSFGSAVVMWGRKRASPRG